jgi:hypothetical protein
LHTKKKPILRSKEINRYSIGPTLPLNTDVYRTPEGNANHRSAIGVSPEVQGETAAIVSQPQTNDQDPVKEGYLTQALTTEPAARVANALTDKDSSNWFPIADEFEINMQTNAKGISTTQPSTKEESNQMTNKCRESTVSTLHNASMQHKAPRLMRVQNDLANCIGYLKGFEEILGSAEHTHISAGAGPPDYSHELNISFLRKLIKDVHSKTKEIFDIVEATMSLPLSNNIVVELEYLRDVAALGVNRLENTVKDIKGPTLYEWTDELIVSTWEMVMRNLDRLWEGSHHIPYSPKVKVKSGKSSIGNAIGESLAKGE